MLQSITWLAAAMLFAAHALAREEGGRPGMNLPVPVTASTAQLQSMPVWVEAQGTVIPRNYVNVMPRVTGMLSKVHFHEGQMVRAGQLLANIDARPFQVQLDMAIGALVRDTAQLNGARQNLLRYESLLQQDAISAQQVADQRSTVSQLIGTVTADKASRENAAMQLEWTRITAPISGMIGLRQVDAGNMVGTAGAIGGGNSALAGTASSSVPIATIAQAQPITVTFALPQSQLAGVAERLRDNEIPVEAWDQRRAKLLDSGEVIAMDNQVNSATGTVMLKAEFSNAHMTLYPNQFVNVRMLLDTLEKSVVIPSAAIAIGARGSYVYVIGNGDVVSVRSVRTGVSFRDLTAITAGLSAGERVVSDGLDRLKEGGKVQIVSATADAAKQQGKRGKAEGGQQRKRVQ